METQTFNFDEKVCRKGSDALKWEALLPRWGREDLLALWIADMEFKTPKAVTECIQNRASHEVFGYTMKPKAWYNSIIDWQKRRNGLDIKEEMLVFTPGIVPGLAMAVQSLTEVGDKILIQQPVYQPFINSVKNNNRVLVNSSLVLKEGKHQIDFQDFEEKAKDCKMFILCNPHNPGGRVWTRQELEKIAEICNKYNIIVVSDEIHSDLTLKHSTFTSYGKISSQTFNNCVIFNSPSKAFNMAGLASAYAIIANEKIREKFSHHLNNCCMLGDGNVFAFLPVVSAYEKGESWLEAMLDYVQENINFTIDFLQKHTPKIKPIIPEASYLIFFDCREICSCQDSLNDFFVDKAHLALNDGSMFGEEGVGFMRINLACNRDFLQKALNQLKEAYEKCNY